MCRGDETLTAFAGIRISILGPSPAIWPIRVMGRMGTRMEGVFLMEGRMQFGSGTRQSVASQRDVPRYSTYLREDRVGVQLDITGYAMKDRNRCYDPC